MGRGNWQQALKARLGTVLLLKFLTTTGGIAVFFYAYFWAMRHPLSAVTVMPVTWLDGLVGFHPQSFALYASLWVYIALGTALPRDLPELSAFGLGSLAMILVGLAIFMLLPTKVPDLSIDWTLYPSLQFLKNVDASGNACPSLHAAFSVFTALALRAQLPEIGAPRWLLACSALWGLGILYSTIATRQHVALDVVAGVVLGGTVSIAYLDALARRNQIAVGGGPRP